MGRGDNIGGFVHNGYHISGPDGLGRFSGFINNFDQGSTPGGHGKVTVGHQFGGFGMARLFDALYQIHGCSDFFECFAYMYNRFV